MSKKRVIQSLLVTTLVFVMWGIFASHAHADIALDLATSVIGGYKDVNDFFSTLMALLANSVLMLGAWWVAFTGILLNVSINITLNIKAFVSSTPAVFEVWKAIRDISGLFIIFTLLYAAIRQILGISPPNFGDLIKNVVIAGVLINFSFFITAALIDASNVVSLAVYRAILPGQVDAGRMLENCVNSGKPADQCAGETLFVSGLASASKYDGGLSALFMQSLQLQSVYNPKNVDLKESPNAVNVSLKIVLISVTGFLIMIIAGLSFLAAAAAFIVRLVILVFLLAFSPIIFAASVVPGVDEYAKEWRNMLKGQLLFMPAYLLLMYAALLVLNKSSFFLNGAKGDLWKGATVAGGLMPMEYLTFSINAVFVIIMINLPLLAAIKLGGSATKFISAKRIGAQGVFGFAGSKVIGGTARAADKYLGKTRIFGGTTLGRDILAGTTGTLKKSQFGGSWRSAEDRNKADKESKVAMSSIQKTRELDKVLAKHPFGITNPEVEKAYGDTFKKFSTKEKLALGKKKLLEPQVLSRLKKSDIEAIEKSDEFTDDEKLEIKNKRKAIFEQAISNKSTDITKRMMKEYEGKDLGGLSKEQYAQIIEHMTEGQLKKIRDDGSVEDQDNIFRAISIAIAAGGRVPKEKWIRDRKADGEWGTPPPAGANPAGGAGRNRPPGTTAEDSEWM